ncbi:DUF2219 family protein [Wenyingzhuangia sp. 1_MG-2023]|nr:DUF2219 family protein [Wenyingzhuangia sp. 1_MG-2023]
MKKHILILLIFTSSLTYSQNNDLNEQIGNEHNYLKELYKGNLNPNIPKDDKKNNTSDFFKNLGNKEKSFKKLDYQSKVKIVSNFVQKKVDQYTMYYRYYNSDKKIIKGVRVYHENDMLGLFQKNQDHEYTGGFQIDIVTDYFGLKILSFRPDDEYLTYQSITFGFELYTPSEINVSDPNNLNPNDRPFASFQYFGRTRNIINIDGDYRSSSEIKIGIIGGDVSRNVQMVVHNDVTPGSSVNKGWDYQIGSGGRLGLQYNLVNEWQKNIYKNNYINYGVNGGVGHLKGFIQPILKITNKTFFEKNPHNGIKTNDFFGTKKWGKQVWKTLFYEMNYSPDYVFFNSMLQGYPFSNEHNVIGNNNNTVGIPVIENINNFVHRFSFGLGFKNYRTTIHYQHFFQSPEYDVSSNPSWDGKTFHHYGRISLTLDL